ncbi:MAG: hypothetical protein IJY50_02510 [Clostridia bacterium]|nr:hypothetical protein [Clostridia bacterium]
MKSTIRLLSLLLALLCVTSCFVACGSMGKLTVAKDGESDYVIVYGRDDKYGKAAANYLAKELEELTGVAFVSQDDSVEADEKIPEILVGRTNRGLELPAQRELRAGEYVIVREKKNVFILADGEGIATEACKDFLNEVLTEDFKVEGSGELLSARANHNVSSLSLNGKPFSEYTLYLPQTDSAEWKTALGYVESYLSTKTGFLINKVKYTSKDDITLSPAIVLEGSTEGLATAEYQISVSGADITVAAGSATAALGVAVACIDTIDRCYGDAMELTLAAGGGKAGENPMVALAANAAIRVMTYNTLGNKDSQIPFELATIMAYAPDFICTQEFGRHSAIVDKLEEVGYGAVGTKFTAISPTALEKAETDPKYDDFAHVGSSSNTPIFYRADLWEPIEEDCGAYLFYWKSRYHYTNTKSLAYGVFRNKTNGELALVIATHFPLMADSYKEKSEYANCTDAKEGVQWRYEAILEVLKEVDRLQAKYPGIMTFVGGDFNAALTEKSMKTIEAHEIMATAYNLAPSDARTPGASYHGAYTKAPNASGNAIDHIFVSETNTAVLYHKIIQDAITLQGSDHCPVIIDVAKK